MTNNTSPSMASLYSIKGRVVWGMVLIGLLGGSIFGWAAHAELSGAVVVTGEVAVDRDLRVVQHRDGGIVQNIAVSAGDTVKEGEVILRLDGASARMERAILHGRIAEYAIRKARLEAQRDLREGFEIPAEISELIVPQDMIDGIFEGENRIFVGGLSSYKSRKEQMILGIEQVRNEILGLEARLNAKLDEIQLVSVEGARMQSLSDRQLAIRNSVFTLQRENVRLAGERGEILSEIGRAQSRISELELDILAIEEKVRTDAQTELGEIETMLSEMNERRQVVEATLSRTEIRAPVSGRINELKVNSIGGVIGPAEILATIVPEAAKLVFSAKVPAVQIEQVSVGRTARLRFSAFDQNETPEINGTVIYVAAAAIRDAASASDFYQIIVSVPDEEISRLGERELRPGMPLEIYVTTEERTALSYFVKPFKDQIARAFRER